MTKERNSIIEPFRLFSMWCVVAHHFVVHNGSPVSVFANPVTRALYNVVFYLSARWLLAALFLFLFGLLLAHLLLALNALLKNSSPLNNEVLFYSVVLGGIALVSGYAQPSASLLIKILFPIATGYGWWFATSYAGLLLLLPFFDERP